VDSAEVALVGYQDFIYVTQIKDDWLKVNVNGGREGWMMRKHEDSHILVPVAPQLYRKAPGLETAELRMRPSPSSEGDACVSLMGVHELIVPAIKYNVRPWLRVFHPRFPQTWMMQQSGATMLLVPCQGMLFSVTCPQQRGSGGVRMMTEPSGASDEQGTLADGDIAVVVDRDVDWALVCHPLKGHGWILDASQSGRGNSKILRPVQAVTEDTGGCERKDEPTANAPEQVSARARTQGRATTPPQVAPG
jgi:hypothetical protein